MIQRMKDAGTLLFLGVLVMTIKATPVETVDALTPEARAAADASGSQRVAQAPPAAGLELPLPVSPDGTHAVLDLGRLAELSRLAEQGAQTRRVIVLRMETDVVTESYGTTDRCPLAVPGPDVAAHAAGGRC